MSAPLVPDEATAPLRTAHSARDSTESRPTPVELLDHALDAQIVRDIRDSAAENTWRAYRADLVDFGGWLQGTEDEWTDPATVADYLRALEAAGAKYATIERRITAIAKVVEVLVAVDQMEPTASPTKHPTVTIALQAIRRRLGTDLEQAAPLTGERMIQVLLAIDKTTRAGRRDIALLLLGWFGAFRRSELAGIRRRHLSIDDHGLAIELPRTKASQENSVWVPVARAEGSRWCPVSALELWIEELDRQPASSETLWAWITKGDNHRQGLPAVGGAAIDGIVRRRAAQSGLDVAASVSAHSLRSGFITEAKNRGIDEADIMRHTRLKSLQIMRRYDRVAGWWNRNPTAAMTL